MKELQPTLPRWLLPALCLLAAALFTLRNLPWHLDDYDQAKQAFVSHEMVSQGNWWLQHTSLGRVATKPPLAGWISAGIRLAFGEQAWEVAWRLPGLVAAGLILWMLARAAGRIAGEWGAVIAVGAFALNLTTPRLATLVRTDMLLAFFIFLAGYLVYEKLRTRTGWTIRDRWQLFLAILASMMTKGPIAYAFLLPGLLAWALVMRGTGESRRIWSGWWTWFMPLVVFGGWLALGLKLSPDFYEQVVNHEFLGRFTVGEQAVHNNQPVYFYFAHLLHRLFPWSIAFVALLWGRELWRRLRLEPETLWLVCWVLGGIVFMSLVPSKRGDRVFSVVPPLCLAIVALAKIRICPTLFQLRGRQITYGLLAISSVFSVSYAAYSVVKGLRDNERTLVAFGKAVRQRIAPSRLAVVNGKDEGMLLYLDQNEFTKAKDGLKQLRAGEIDGLVIPTDDLAKVKANAKDLQILLTSGASASPAKQSAYALVVRGQPSI